MISDLTLEVQLAHCSLNPSAELAIRCSATAFADVNLRSLAEQFSPMEECYSLSMNGTDQSADYRGRFKKKIEKNTVSRDISLTK